MRERSYRSPWAVGLAALGALLAPPLALSSLVEWSVSFDGVIENPNGSWGGTLPVAASRATNLTVVFRFQRRDQGVFELLGMQVADNARGLVSDRFVGNARLVYDWDFDGTNDAVSRASGNLPGGFIAPAAVGEFGVVGDPLPSGADFDALVNADVVNAVMAFGPANGDQIIAQDLQPGSFAFTSRVLPGPTLDLVHCPGDVDGDTIPDLVVADLDGSVSVKRLDGTAINSFTIDTGEALVDLEIVADSNGNGAAELVALRRGAVEAEIRDLLTSGQLASIAFPPDLAPVDLEVLAASGNSGTPRLAFLGFDPITLSERRIPFTVDIRDSVTGLGIRQLNSVGWSVPQDLRVAESAGADPELMVLGDNARLRRADDLQIFALQAPSSERRVWVDRDWYVLSQESAGDVDGNGMPDVAILRVQPPKRVNVQIRDLGSSARVNYVGFAEAYPPIRFLTIPDLNRNGARELVMFGVRYDGRNQKAVVKDSRSGERLRTLWFDPAYPGYSMTDCGDLNGNGTHDLAVLGERGADGSRVVIVKDSGTTDVVTTVAF